MNEVEFEQESLRSHVIDCKTIFPNISSCRIFLNLIQAFEEKYYTMNKKQRIDFLHDLYIISGCS